MRLCFLGVICFLTACSDDRLTGDPTQSLVDGLWESSCLESESGYSKSSYLFSFADTVAVTDTQYLDQCETASSQSLYTGKYELSVTWQSYIHRIQMDISSSSLKIFDPEAANQEQLCGYNDWSEAAAGSEQLNLQNCPLKFSSDFKFDTYIQLKDDLLVTSEPFGPTLETPSGFGTVEVSRTFVRQNKP